MFSPLQGAGVLESLGPASPGFVVRGYLALSLLRGLNIIFPSLQAPLQSALFSLEVLIQKP